eukprot:TRINITY_DN4365_c0_g1_i1.p1 TRINITY_DN4365_c0_g1~~TRINITY_DN4365_c0_g1_i1.p1  ORF type:complete len:476 (-),score=173.70 TRINITY_DN4365_c0_g1_i1:33-1460(-)
MQFVNDVEPNVSELNEESSIVINHELRIPHESEHHHNGHINHLNSNNNNNNNNNVSEIYENNESSQGPFATILPSGSLSLYNVSAVYIATLSPGYSLLPQSTSDNLNHQHVDSEDHNGVDHLSNDRNNRVESEISEEEEDGNKEHLHHHHHQIHSNKRDVQHRWRPNEDQRYVLESVWNQSNYPSSDVKESIAKQFGNITYSQISSWFKHKRETCKSKGKMTFKRASPLKFSAEQVNVLEEGFRVNPYAKSKLLKEISEKLDVDMKRVQNWFKHRRSKLANDGKFHLRSSRTSLNPNQLAFLRGAYFTNNNPSTEVAESMGKELNLSMEQIHKWFVNERHRRKKKQEAEENNAVVEQIHSLETNKNDDGIPSQTKRRDANNNNNKEQENRTEEHNQAIVVDHSRFGVEEEEEGDEEMIESNGIVAETEEDEVEIEGEEEEEELDFGSQHNHHHHHSLSMPSQYYNETFLKNKGYH